MVGAYDTLKRTFSIYFVFMIRFLSGVVLSRDGQSIVIDVGGVGYGVSVSEHVSAAASVGEEMKVHVYTHVREQEITLYGFIGTIDRAMFLLLISVSGIGPKAALAILSQAEASAIASAIVHKDTSIFISISGVGKKTAEKVVVELQGRVDAFASADAEAAMLDIQAIDALKSMGYSIGEARDALSHVDKSITDVSERIRAALKNLG